MEITRSGSQPSSKGPAEWFTGSVRIDPLFEAPEPARVRGASVTFEPDSGRSRFRPLFLCRLLV
jgi:quercetin dioxygenase-like cupin family protein